MVLALQDMSTGTARELQSTHAAVAMSEHDPAAIFREHAPYVWRVLRRLGVAESDVDDVLQDVFIVVHRNVGGFEGRSSLRTWIYSICVRVVADHRKRAHIQREERVSSVPEQAEEAPQDALLDRLRARAMLDAILEEMDEPKRVAFVLFELEQLPIAEVAQIVGCPLQTAYSRLTAARDEFRCAVERHRARRRAP